MELSRQRYAPGMSARTSTTLVRMERVHVSRPPPPSQLICPHRAGSHIPTRWSKASSHAPFGIAGTRNASLQVRPRGWRGTGCEYRPITRGGSGEAPVVAIRERRTRPPLARRCRAISRARCQAPSACPGAPGPVLAQEVATTHVSERRSALNSQSRYRNAAEHLHVAVDIKGRCFHLLSGPGVLHLFSGPGAVLPVKINTVRRHVMAGSIGQSCLSTTLLHSVTNGLAGLKPRPNACASALQQ